MKILDIDMDYFMTKIAISVPESTSERLSEEYYGDCVWSEDSIRCFLENNIGLSKNKKIKGRIVTGHNEAIPFWKELIEKNELTVPFEVIHVDSHADLGLGYSSWTYILNFLLQYPVHERPIHNRYVDLNGGIREEGIGDYLLFAVAYRWISRLTYCANPYGDKNDYILDTLKDFSEEYIWDEPVENIIQLVYNPEMDFPSYDSTDKEKSEYLAAGVKEPEVPMLIIPTVKDVNFNDDFDFIVFAQSPNYTPASADFVIDIFREYIDEC